MGNGEKGKSFSSIPIAHYPQKGFRVPQSPIPKRKILGGELS
ncbi:hypothetical protein Cylst_0692 [Cylindrospermum stagnale PCC 7417]|uniref:Uncharacterized protein n=1 Tax=Cylindrospermum stagnale PCC 7417 TaxID=56107 RepID=K9WRL2_9NOST|nr:hypothetical protein Cylst_0692 [Cylindrospermum stagnale PCC 7417]